MFDVLKFKISLWRCKRAGGRGDYAAYIRHQLAAVDSVWFNLPDLECFYENARMSNLPDDVRAALVVGYRERINNHPITLAIKYISKAADTT